MYFSILYSFAIEVLELALGVLGLFSSKIRRMRIGRKVGLTRIRQFRSTHPDVPLMWFHAASVGEFEQALPIIRSLKEADPNMHVAVSFFSPSGFEQKGKNPLVDLAFYLPADRKQSIRKIIRELRPGALVLVKYEFWFHLIHSSARLGVPVISVCCILRPGSFSGFRGLLLKKTFPWIRYFFVQNGETAQILREKGFSNLQINGDTRVDRVLEIRESASDLPWLEDWKGSAKLLIIGSAWAEDLVFLQEFIRHAVVEAHGLWKLLIVPHEVEPSRLRHLLAALPLPFELYSDWKESQNETDILVLNTTGLLSRSYRHADAAWIGGAFKTGLHNTLEAAVYGIPIGFGPRYDKFQEARDLIRIGAAKSFPQAGSVWSFFQEATENPESRQALQEATSAYFDSQKGASRSIVRYLEEQVAGGNAST